MHELTTDIYDEDYRFGVIARSGRFYEVPREVWNLIPDSHKLLNKRETPSAP